MDKSCKLNLLLWRILLEIDTISITSMGFAEIGTCFWSKKERMDKGTEKMLSSIPQVFPLFRKVGPFIQHGRENSLSSATGLEKESSSTPLRMSTNWEAYRPGELIITTVEVHNGKCLVDNNAQS